jgi:hypothetical protein
MSNSNAEIILSIFFVFFCLGLVVLILAGMYMTFKKMGYENAWWIFIPIANIIFMLQVIDRPIWWILLMFIPCIGYIVGFIVQWELCMKVARAYGGGAPLALGLFFLGFVFFPYVGFFSNPNPNPG